MTPRLLGRIIPRYMRSYPTSTSPSPPLRSSSSSSSSTSSRFTSPSSYSYPGHHHSSLPKPLAPLYPASALARVRVRASILGHLAAPFHSSPAAAMASSATAIDTDSIAQLQNYTACDVSDALLKLKVPNAGFIADLNLYSPAEAAAQSPSTQAPVTVCPVSTVLFTPKDQSADEVQRAGLPPSNIPKDAHWVDLAVPSTFAVLKQPVGQINAVCGGILALRMKVLDVKGVVVAGRVRDLVELRSTGLPIWARGTSTVGAGASSKPWATQIPIDIDGVTVTPGDLAVHDPTNGVVIIPQDKVGQVLELLPKLTSSDDRAKEDVAKGVTVSEAFKRHRG